MITILHAIFKTKTKLKKCRVFKQNYTQLKLLLSQLEDKNNSALNYDNKIYGRNNMQVVFLTGPSNYQQSSDALPMILTIFLIPFLPSTLTLRLV